MLKTEALQLLDQKVATCTKCSGLTEYRQAHDYKTVPGAGDSNARIMILGEAPGENEAKQGIPFVGKAGHLLTNILKAMGLKRSEVFITNTLKCRPPGNRDPELSETANCRKFLDLQIKVIDPEWIVCFGRVAAVNLLGKDEFTSIGSLRGKVHEWLGRKVICTYHPSFVLHQKEEDEQKRAKSDIWRDLQPLVVALQNKTGAV
jgi:DNA polymerase